MPITFNRGEWAFVIEDAAVNYAIEDYAAAILDHPSINDGHPLPVVVFQARHIETDIVVNLTLRVPPHMLQQCAIVFAGMVADLEQRGALP